LRRTPAFTLASLVTIALGIGAATTIFTIVNAALLKPLPYPDADELLTLAGPGGASAQTGQLFLYLRERLQSFERIAAQRSSNGWNLVAGDLVVYVEAERVSEGFFDAHGVPPLLGRGFSRAEDSPGGPNAVVISETLWREAYGGRPGAIGETLLLGGVPHTLVGVMPRTFRSIPDADVWTPIQTTRADNGQNYRVFGRLRPGVTAADAVAEFEAARADIEREFPRTNPRRLAATTWMPLRQLLGSNVRQSLLLLLAAVGFLMLIACVNVGSLQLTRALARRRDMAARAALGCSRGRLARYVLTEAALLACAGAVAGTVLALASARFLLGLVSENLSREILSGADATIDWRVLAFTAAAALFATVFFGVVPALAATRADLRLAMSEGMTATLSRRTIWLRRALAGVEVALAAVLLVGGGLLVRTLLSLASTDVGFTPAGVVVGRMSLQGAVEDGPELQALLDRGLDGIRRIPGIAAAAAGSSIPILPGLNLALVPPDGARVQEIRAVDWKYVTPDYFAVLGVPVRAGRAFDRRDGAGASPVAIVNEALARAYFGRANAVGETIALASGPDDLPRRIVGVVADTKARSNTGWTRGLTALGSATAPAMFVPAGQAPASSIRTTHRIFDMSWVIRSDRQVGALQAELQAAMRSLAPTLPFVAVESMEAVIARELDYPRFLANLFAGFGALGALLAAIGLYGLIAYAAEQRTREVGIRMALGATASDVLRRFAGEGLAVAGAGLAAGLLGALLVTRLLTALLFGVTPLDPATFTIVAALLLLVAAAASLIPAARAAAINPTRALRH
jgi:predicted permease